MIKIKRTEIADKLKNIDYGQTNLTPEILKKVLEELTITTLKGASPKDCKAKNHIPDNFEWKEFDIWRDKFKEADEYPAWWEAISDYDIFQTEFNEFAIDELLDELAKDELLVLAEKFNLKKIKSEKKKELSKILASVIPPEDKESRGFIFKTINAALLQNMIKEKKYLFQMTLISVSAETSKKEEWEGWGYKKTKFVPGPDSCSFCNKLAGIYVISEIPIPGKDTHPGCMCSISTAGDDEAYGLDGGNESRAKYLSGEFPMKRCPYCSEWTEGNSVKCRNCNKEL